MKTKYKIKLGSWGEELAAQFLVNKGYQIIDQNYRIKGGEIDLICAKDQGLVFVEVKTRTTKNFGFAEEAVDQRKRQKIHRAIENYLTEHKTKLSPRLDVIIVELFSPKPNFIHYENVELE
jgi:putative endonuclease